MGRAEEILDAMFPDILDLSRKIYKFAEIGSSEKKSSAALNRFLSEHGFSVQQPFANMDTAFKATRGKGKIRVGFLAEYDALPNGHSCGHNLISAWALGSAALLADLSDKFTISVFGTPSEEGIGEYAGSKVTMSEMRVFSDIDFIFGFHADDRWAVGSVALADSTLEITFTGKESHGADAPESGINALDAAVSAYNAINSLRGWSKNDKNLVVGMIFKEAGEATNIIPGKAVLLVEIRSTSYEFAGRFSEKVRKAAIASADIFGAVASIRTAAPFYREYLPNFLLDELLLESLHKYGIEAHNIDRDPPIASGSTDEANVSHFVPVGHMDMKIGFPGIPGHTDDFRIASEPDKNSINMRVAILSTVSAAISAADKLEDVKSEFRRRKGE